MSDNQLADEAAAALDIETEPEVVIDLTERTNAENVELSTQLGLVGKGPTPLFFVNARLDTLVDFLMSNTADALAAFECGVALRINAGLKAELARVRETLVVPNAHPSA